MKNVGFASATGGLLHRILEPGHSAAVGITENRYRRDFVHANAPVAHTPSLVHLEHLLIDFDVVPEVTAVTDLAEQGDFFIATHARQVIPFVGERAHEVVPGRWVQRCLRGKIFPRKAAVAGHKLARAVGFLIKGDRIGETHLVVQILIEVLVELLHVDADIPQQVFGHIGVARRRINRLGAAVSNPGPAIDLELIAFCMAAEIVVVIENQDTRRGIFSSIKVRCRKTANTAAHDNEFVVLFDRADRPCGA